jgi:hypothetical protein
LGDLALIRPVALKNLSGSALVEGIDKSRRVKSNKIGIFFSLFFQKVTVEVKF